MTLQPVGYEDADISLASGKLRVRRWGAADAPAVVCVPGLSAKAREIPRALAIWAGFSPRSRRALAAANLSASITTTPKAGSAWT